MVYRFGSFIIDTTQYEIIKNSMPISVEPKVFDLIIYLIENRKRLVTRDELFNSIWQGREISDTALSNGIKSARRIFEDDGVSQHTIKTIRGRGYQFIATIEILDLSVSPAASHTAQKNGYDAESENSRSLLNLKPTFYTKTHWNILTYSLVAIFFVSLIGWYYFQNYALQQTISKRPYILVVPFEIAKNESPKWQPFADQMTRDVIRNLRKISGLKVIPQSSAFTFKNIKNHTFIRKQLPEVNFVLSASINVWQDSRVQVVPELENLESGKLVWDSQFESRIDDTTFFSIKSEITKALSEALKVALLTKEKSVLSQLPTDNLKAYELYVLGQNKKDELTRTSLLEAIDLYTQAIRLDPSFEAAYVAKADAYRIIMTYVAVPASVLPKVTETVSDTLKVNPLSAEALSSLGLAYAFSWRWQDAWKVLNQAKKLNPDLALTEIGFAIYYSGIGDVEAMKHSLKKANQIDPLNIELADWGHWALAMAGEFDAAIKWSEEKMRLHPNVGMIYSGASVSASLTGDHNRAIALAREGLRLETDSPYPLLALAQAYGYAGQTEKVLPLLSQAEQSDTYLCKYESAIVHLILNDTSQAFENFNKAVDDRSNCLVFTRNDPRLKPIRSDKRYHALLMKIGLDNKSIASYPR